MTTSRAAAPIDLLAEADALTELWSPRVVGRVNDQYIKVAKVQGELVWHAHADEDECFMVLRGSLTLQFEDGEVVLQAGQSYVVPAGVRHNPVAADVCCLALVETVTTQHTGDVVIERTRTISEQLR